MAYMGQFKDDYKMQSYDYPIITIPPKENMLLVKFDEVNNEEEAKKIHDFRQQNRLQRIKRNIFKAELDYLDSLNKRQRQIKISELIPTTYPSISHLPIRALISPLNTKVINKKFLIIYIKKTNGNKIDFFFI